MSVIETRVRDGRREAWVIVCGVGGWVCGEPDLPGVDSICGMPVESEPCSQCHPGWEDHPCGRCGLRTYDAPSLAEGEQVCVCDHSVWGEVPG